jgi:hypothetical protein
MTEFAAGASVMSLLLLGVLALGGYQEIDRRGAVSARQLAWQQSWGQEPADADATRRSLHQLHLADGGARDPHGRQLLVAEEDLTIHSEGAALSGVAGVAAQALLSPLRTASGFLGAGFDLSADGLSEGVVQSRIAPVGSLPEPFGSLELRLQARHALLSDAWHAGSVGHVRQRAGGLVPASRLQALNEVWKPLSLPLGVVEPSLRKLCFGLIEPDRIPEDRLGNGRTALPDACP